MTIRADSASGPTGAWQQNPGIHCTGTGDGQKAVFCCEMLKQMNPQPTMQIQTKSMNTDNLIQSASNPSMNPLQRTCDGQVGHPGSNCSPKGRFFLGLMYVCLWLAAMVVFTPGIAAPIAAKLLPIIHGVTNAGVSTQGPAPAWLITVVAAIIATQVAAITAACARADLRFGPVADVDPSIKGKWRLMKTLEANARPSSIWIAFLILACVTLYLHDQSRISAFADISGLPIGSGAVELISHQAVGTEPRIPTLREILIEVLPLPSVLPYALLTVVAFATMVSHLIIAPREQQPD
jgi:hypothetical protein